MSAAGKAPQRAAAEIVAEALAALDRDQLARLDAGVAFVILTCPPDDAECCRSELSILPRSSVKAAGEALFGGDAVSRWIEHAIRDGQNVIVFDRRGARIELYATRCRLAPSAAWGRA